MNTKSTPFFLLGPCSPYSAHYGQPTFCYGIILSSSSSQHIAYQYNIICTCRDIVQYLLSQQTSTSDESEVHHDLVSEMIDKSLWDWVLREEQLGNEEVEEAHAIWIMKSWHMKQLVIVNN